MSHSRQPCRQMLEPIAESRVKGVKAVYPPFTGLNRITKAVKEFLVGQRID
jgi:hypothetical protein